MRFSDVTANFTIAKLSLDIRTSQVVNMNNVGWPCAWNCQVGWHFVRCRAFVRWLAPWQLEHIEKEKSSLERSCRKLCRGDGISSSCQSYILVFFLSKTNRGRWLKDKPLRSSIESMDLMLLRCFISSFSTRIFVGNSIFQGSSHAVLVHRTRHPTHSRLSDIFDFGRFLGGIWPTRHNIDLSE